MSSPGVPVPRMLFGVNLGWINLGDGILLEGELISDRSFQDLDGVGVNWVSSPGTGTVERRDVDGDPAPTGREVEPGCMVLTVSGDGSPVGVSQRLLMQVKTGEIYDLYYSTYAESGSPAMYAYLAEITPFSAITQTDYQLTTVGAWTRHHVTLTVTADSVFAGVFLGALNAGVVRVDEVRLFRAGLQRPAVDPLVKQRMGELGVTSFIWPGGTLADTMDWSLTVGNLLERGELPGTFGERQTPSWGLDEALRLAEELGLTLVLQINVFNSPQSAVDMVEYVNGDASSTMGALRAANGHPAPYNIQTWQLGNEPTLAFQGSDPTSDNIGSNYAQLSRPIVDAIVAAGFAVSFSAAAEVTFEQAEWLPAAPFLQNWNPQVFTGADALTSRVAMAHGHFYSFNGPATTEEETFRYVMAGGSILAGTLASVAALNGGLPMWLTEYAVTVTDSNNVIDVSYLQDLQSALVMADLLVTMMQEGVPAAHLFTLAEEYNWGVLVGREVRTVRPSGLVLGMFSTFRDEPMLPVTVAGAGTYTVSTGAGAVPADAQYELVEAVATRQVTGHARVMLLSREYGGSHVVSVPSSTATAARIHRLEHSDLRANNETLPTEVRVIEEDVTFTGELVLRLAPHSLVRIDFR